MESPNLNQTRILGRSQLVLKIVVIYPDRKGHLAISIQNIGKFGLLERKPVTDLH